MRRFDYASYVTPDDPKKLRQQNQGKFRTDAGTFPEVAKAFVADKEAMIEGPPDAELADDPVQNQFQFKYRAYDPYPCEVYTEMQEVAEASTHPLTREGFLAWAEARVKDNPVCQGSPNTVELELAAALHGVQVDRLQDFKASELRSWLADVIWVGHQGCAEKNRDELLQEIEAEIIDMAEGEFTTIEDALE